MRGKVQGGIKVSQPKNKGKSQSIHAEIDWDFHEVRPNRLFTPIGEDETNKIEVGFTLDGYIYAIIDGKYAETTISEIAYSVSDALPNS